MKVDRRALQVSQALRVASRTLVHGHRDGNRSSVVRGRGVEFADYRPYVPGDDLRLVDWNVYGRLKQMVVRLFHEDRVMGIRIVLDCSASMVAHRGEKSDYAANIAAVLSMVGLEHRDTVHLMFAGENVDTSEVTGHDLRAFPRLLQAIESTTPSGVDCVLETVTRAQRFGSKDLVVVISDGYWTPDRRDRVLKTVAMSGHHAVLFHVLSQADRVPKLVDGQSIQDAETGQRRTIRWDAAAQRAHAEARDCWQSELQAQCRRLGVRYLPCATHSSFLDALRRGDVVGVSS